MLNYPDFGNVTPDTTERNPHFRSVVHYVNPDILVTQENASSSSSNMFLNYVMNSNVAGQYTAGTYINGFDTDNAIYFLTGQFNFISNTPIHTALRDINAFKLVHLLSGDTIIIYSCHLKASAGPPNDSLRNKEVGLLRQVTNALPAGTDFIICGDFNTYSDVEPCYLSLLQDNSTDDGNFVDPIHLTGTWNQFAYRSYHTQSTRRRSFGNGSTGGMDDRFDMILFSTAVSAPGRITYVPNSTVPIGNDGNHYNDSINQVPNFAVPLAVANALHYASDHLPVTANFNFTVVTGVDNLTKDQLHFNIYPNPATEKITVSYSLKVAARISMSVVDVAGKTIMQFTPMQQFEGYHENQNIDVSNLNPGIYMVKLTAENFIINRKLIIMK